MRRSAAVGVVVVAIVLVVLASGLIYLRGGSTPVAPGVAVQRFRDQTAEAPGPPKTPDRVVRDAATSTPPAASRTAPNAARLSAPRRTARPHPADGVYSYATTGYDSVDIFGGSTHTYPSTTTITVRYGGCGLIEHWDVLQERWDERESCPTPGGDVFRRETSYHEFFRHPDLRTFSCAGYTYRRGTRRAPRGRRAACPARRRS